MTTSTTRRAAALAGPAAVLSLLLFLAALAVSGSDAAALTRSPLGVASAALGLLSTGLLLLGLVHLVRTSPHLQEAPVAVLAAGTGTLLLAGGAWAQLVVVPALAAEAPRLANEGMSLVTAGYVVSFLATGLGWLLVALRLRGTAVPRAHVRLMIAGSALMISPLPARWFLLALAVTLMVRPREVAAASPAPVPATA